MKAALIQLVCCGGLLLALLLAANVGVVTGLLRSNLLVVSLGLAVILGVIYYLRRRYRRWRPK